MRRTEADASRLRSLPINKAAFVEPMECLSVSPICLMARFSGWRIEKVLRCYKAWQSTQFQIGDESIESVRMQLTIETNFSLKIPDPIRPGNTLEEFRVITIRLQAVQSTERCSMKPMRRRFSV
jgi:hypothetical protein